MRDLALNDAEPRDAVPCKGIQSRLMFSIKLRGARKPVIDTVSHSVVERDGQPVVIAFQYSQLRSPPRTVSALWPAGLRCRCPATVTPSVSGPEQRGSRSISSNDSSQRPF
jgi:hypothetical protein